MGVIYGSVENMSRYGDGYGDGCGDGYGDGDGDGYGDGDGSGYGYGYGSGYDKSYLQAVADGAAGARAANLRAQGAVIAFWRSDKNGQPVNGGSGSTVQPGMVQEEKGPLVPCQRGALHATMEPTKWKGDRLWVVALYPPVERVGDDKFASLKREIIAEVRNWFD